MFTWPKNYCKNLNAHSFSISRAIFKFPSPPESRKGTLHFHPSLGKKKITIIDLRGVGLQNYRFTNVLCRFCLITGICLQFWPLTRMLDIWQVRPLAVFIEHVVLDWIVKEPSKSVNKRWRYLRFFLKVSCILLRRTVCGKLLPSFLCCFWCDFKNSFDARLKNGLYIFIRSMGRGVVLSDSLIGKTLKSRIFSVFRAILTFFSVLASRSGAWRCDRCAR